MHLAPRPPFRPAARILLLVALAVASLTLTQCRMVGDRLNGIDAGIFRRSDACKKQCQDEYQARNQAENELNLLNLAACAGEPTCIANENARHAAAEAASKAQRDACINSCHQQGAGTVGQ